MSRNILQFYFDLIKDIPRLTQDEEYSLIHKAQKGDMNAHRKVVESNLKLVVYVAKKYRNKNILLEDSIAQGNIGLMRAVDKFDLDTGNSFRTYAVIWIKHVILRYIDYNKEPIRVPLYIGDKIRSSKNGKKITKETQRNINLSKKTYVPMNIALANGEDMDLSAILGGNCQSIELAEQRIDVEELTKMLTPKEKRIVRLRSEGHSLGGIGKMCGVSRERIRQIEAKAMEKIKKYVRFCEKYGLI